MRSRLPRGYRRALFAVHLTVAGVALSSCAWILTDAAKEALVERLDAPVLDWAALFRHPSEAALLPYLVTCLVAFGYGLFLYLRLRRPAARLVRWLRRTECARHSPLLFLVLAAQPVLLVPELPRTTRLLLGFLSLLACVVRLPRRAGASRAPGRAALRSTAVRTFCLLATGVLVVALAVEPLKLALRPTQLLNEYRHLPERALPCSGEGEARRECERAPASALECSYQYMSRGQVNHVGHVLNPISEYLAGKPSAEIYFQYGRGATFLWKALMDLFGGLSLQDYYRTSLVYVAYWLVFVAAAASLFRDARYLLAATTVVAVSYYMLGYHGLVLAPGINPLLHFLDMPVLLAALGVFRTGRSAPVALGIAGAAAAVAINSFYGLMVAAAFVVSCSMYVLENAAPGRRALRIAGLVAGVALPLAALAALTPRAEGGAGVVSHFLLGFFSWRPPAPLVLLSLAYLAGSYVFLLWMRERRDPLKYAFVFLFVYAQGFLTYFYWSGLTNHFWPVFPYLGLHLLVAVRMLGPVHVRWERGLLATAIFALAVALKPAVDGFVAERAAFRKVFSYVEAHRWPFPRARVVATADPAPLAASVAQVQRYSGDGSGGICILSVLDNLIPFLAERYSILPHFELQWSLITDRERERVIRTIVRERPAVLFVGHEVEDPAADRWDGACRAFDMPHERVSAQGRVREMNRVFEAVAADYERVESGPLLSVYRRRDASAPAASAAR